MEALLVVAALVIAAAIAFVKLGSARTQATKPVGEVSDERSSSPAGSHREWLENRWRAAEKAHSSCDYTIFPEWYFEAATDRQLARLERQGVKGVTLTKGQASDLIGMTEPPDEHEIAVLKFFGVPLGQMNQTMARVKVLQLMEQEGNAERWNNRPATSEQKQDIRFLGGKVTKGLSATEAQRILSDLQEASPEKSDDLDNLKTIFDDFSDADFRETMGIKKPGRAAIQEAIDLLVAAGQSLEDLAINTDAIADKLLELHPELARDL